MLPCPHGHDLRFKSAYKAYEEFSTVLLQKVVELNHMSQLNELIRCSYPEDQAAKRSHPAEPVPASSPPRRTHTIPPDSAIRLAGQNDVQADVNDQHLSSAAVSCLHGPGWRKSSLVRELKPTHFRSTVFTSLEHAQEPAV